MFSLIRIASFWRSCSCRDKQASILLCWSLWELGVIDKGLWLGQTLTPRYRNWCVHFSESSLCSTEPGGFSFFPQASRGREKCFQPVCDNRTCRDSPWSQSQPSAVQGGLYATLLRLSSEAAAGNPCRNWGISGVSWSIRCLRDRRFGTNSVTSKITEEWRWVGHAVGLVPRHPWMYLRTISWCLTPPAVEKGVLPKHYSWLRGSGTSPAQGPSCLPPPPPSTPQLLWDSLLHLPCCSGRTEWRQTARFCRCWALRSAAGHGGASVCLKGCGRAMSTPAKWLKLRSPHLFPLFVLQPVHPHKRYQYENIHIIPG